MCGNSGCAAAVSAQRQPSYGLCLEGKVAKWFEAHTVDFSVSGADKLQSWVFQKLKAWCPRASTCSDETNPFVVRAIRRQIHSFILGTDK